MVGFFWWMLMLCPPDYNSRALCGGSDGGCVATFFS